jgi:probable rRNA maturation factor
MSRARHRCRIEWAGLALSPADRALAQRAVDAALARDDLADRALCVLIVDDAESARLHDEHFSDPAPTDVMSFPDGGPDPESGLVRLGDLAVGLEVARRVAATRGRPVGEEVALYVLHGALHLLGYDDIDERDRADMWAIQREVMATLGVEIGPPAA